MAFRLDTDRLYLREQTLDDVDALYAIMSDPHTMRYYPAPYSRERVEAVIHRSMGNYRDYRFGLWAVILKVSEEFIGQCGISLQNIDGRILPEIGYQISRNYWGRGYAPEAARTGMEYGFSPLNLPELYIHTSTENLPSIRVAEKMGFQLEKRYRKVFDDGTSNEHVVYRQTKEDYLRLLS